MPKLPSRLRLPEATDTLGGMKRSLPVLAVAGLALAGCASASQVPGTVTARVAFSDDVQLQDAPSWWDQGSADAYSGDGNSLRLDASESVGGDVLCTSHALSGSQVTIRDASGTTVAIAPLDAGTPSDVGGFVLMKRGVIWDVRVNISGNCTFVFDVSLTPSSDFYSVSVAGIPGETQLTKEKLLDGIELTL